MIDQVTELVTVLIQMQQNKVLSWRISNLSHILISRYFQHLPILNFFSLSFELSHSICVELFGEIILKIKIIFEFLKLLLVLLCEYIFEFVLLLVFLFHLLLFLVKSFFLLIWEIIAMLDLKIKPLCCNFVSHLVFDVV